MSSITIQSEHEPIERAKAKTQNRPTFADGALFSTISEALGEMRSTFECLEKAEAYLSSVLPDTIDLCESPQDGASPLKLLEVSDTAECAVSPMVKINTPDENACSSSSFGTSPTATRLMFWGDNSTRECNATASLQASKDIAKEMIKIKQLMHCNLEIIEWTAEHSEMLLALIQEKTEENHELLSLMIEISDRQAIIAEDGSYISMSDGARSMMREIVCINARMMATEGKGA